MSTNPEVKEIKQGGIIYHPISRAEAIRVGDTTLDAVLRDIFDGSLNLSEFKKQFLSKINEDEARECITFIKGLKSKDKSIFEEGIQDKLLESESAWSIGYDSYGNSVLTVDKLKVKLEAIFTSYVVEKMSQVNGGTVYSCASMKVTKVDYLGSLYRCYFEDGEGTVMNNFEIEDQARCQVYSGSKQKYYWRLVVNIGKNYIDLSNIDKDGEGVPEDGDEIFQLGNRDNVSRQSALIIKSYETAELAFYDGINSYTLSDKADIIISRNGSKFTGDFILRSGNSIEDELNKRNKYTLHLTNENESVPCTNAGVVVGSLPTSEVYLFEGTELQTDWNLTLVCDGCEALLTGNLIELTALKEDKATVKVVASKVSETSVSKVMSISKVRAGDGAIQVNIFTSSGQVTINNDIDIFLIAQVLKGGEDITDSIAPNFYSWERISINEDNDPIWNEQHIGVGNKIRIGNADMLRKAQFDCIVNI